MRTYAEAVKLGVPEIEPFRVQWLSNKLPILTTKKLLRRSELNRFIDFFPQEEILKDSMVYHTKMKKEVKSEYLRNSRGVRERSDVVLEEIDRSIVGLVQSSLESIPNFCQLIFRKEETEWILYKNLDFFKIHQDFERYVCDDMAPYVLLYGLENTVCGGETIVYDGGSALTFHEGSIKNGALFFPGHLPHEARCVYEGSKKCLKLEFFVFFYSDAPLLRCVDPVGKHDSYWSLSFIRSIDCFLSSFSRFKSEDKNIVTDMAPSLQRLLISLHDRRFAYPDQDFDFLFPNMEYSFLQDLYSLNGFIENSSRSVFLSKNAMIWDWFFQSAAYPEYLPLILVWTKTSKNSSYLLEDVYTKDGKQCYRNMDCELFNTKEYIDYSRLSTMAQKNKIVEKEGRSRYSMFRESFRTRIRCKETSHCNASIKKEEWNEIYKSLSDIQPNDVIHEPRYHSAHFERQTYEMCNCEDAGFETYTEDVYITLYIQIRWILVRLPRIE